MNAREVRSVGDNESASLMKKVSVIVVTRNRPSQFSACLASISKWGAGSELIVVDDNSTPVYASVGLSPSAKLIRNASREFLSRSRNKGAALASRDYLLFVDDDNVVRFDSIPLLAKTLEAFPDIGVAAPVAFTPEGKTWYAGGSMSRRSGITRFSLRGVGEEELPLWLFETGLFHNCFMVRADLFRKLRGFDDRHFPMYLGEADLGERIRELGARIVVNPAARVTHEIEFGKDARLLRNLHITEPARAYYVGRNRLLLFRIHRSKFDRTVFTVVWQPFFLLIHLSVIMATPRGRWSRLSLGRSYVRGVMDAVVSRPASTPGVV